MTNVSLPTETHHGHLSFITFKMIRVIPDWPINQHHSRQSLSYISMLNPFWHPMGYFRVTQCCQPYPKSPTVKRIIKFVLWCSDRVFVWTGLYLNNRYTLCVWLFGKCLWDIESCFSWPFVFMSRSCKILLRFSLTHIFYITLQSFGWFIKNVFVWKKRENKEKRRRHHTQSDVEIMARH